MEVNEEELKETLEFLATETDQLHEEVSGLHQQLTNVSTIQQALTRKVQNDETTKTDGYNTDNLERKINDLTEKINKMSSVLNKLKEAKEHHEERLKELEDFFSDVTIEIEEEEPEEPMDTKPSDLINEINEVSTRNILMSMKIRQGHITEPKRIKDYVKRLKMYGHKNKDIAILINRSERQISRYLNDDIKG